MKIVNTAQGKPYQLAPDTQLTVERTNPFFHGYGEQTVPVAMPASDHNRRLLGFPDMTGSTRKIPMQDVTISDGEYFVHARQAILSAQRHGNIETSFYMNEGAFYSLMKNVQLRDIFTGDLEFVPGVNSVEEGIQFCRSLLSGDNAHYDIFPVAVDDDSGTTVSRYERKFINAYGHTLEDGRFALTAIDGSGDFQGAVARKEMVDGAEISLAPGYFVTPFIRANYVLECLFAHFGYQVDLGFFALNEPFNRMVIVNNCIDAMVNGHIYHADLVPEVSANDMLNLYRNKFCCEFIPDEKSKTVHVVLLNEVLDAKPDADLSDCIVGNPTISYRQQSDRERIVIKAATSLSASDNEKSEDTVGEMLKANPKAWYDQRDGMYYQTVFQHTKVEKKEIVAAGSMPYDTMETQAEHTITVPECIPVLQTVNWLDAYGNPTDPQKWLYIGKYHCYNSNLKVGLQEVSQNEKNDLKLMLVTPVAHSWWPHGIVTNYDYMTGNRLFGYSLLYNGVEGTFERFYRQYDTLLRNGLDTIKTDIRMPDSYKADISAHRKIVIRGVPVLPDKLKFTLGSKSSDPQQCEFLSLENRKPIETAPVLAPDYNPQYEWVACQTVAFIANATKPGALTEDYWGDNEFADVYPPLPAADQCYGDDGQNYRRHFQQTVDTGYKVKGWMGDYTLTFVECYYVTRWLECHPR